MLEDVVMGEKKDRVILKFEKSTSEDKALMSIGVLLSDFYSQESMKPLYKNFTNLAITPNNPSRRKKNPDPEQVTYIMTGNHQSYALRHARNIHKETRRLVLRFFNILKVLDADYAAYQVMFSVRDTRFLTQFISDDASKLKEMQDFCVYAATRTYQKVSAE